MYWGTYLGVLSRLHVCLLLPSFRSQEAVQPLYCHYGNKRLAARPLKCLSIFSELQPFQPNSGLPIEAVMDICGFVASLQTMCVLFRQPGAFFLSPSSGLIKFAPIYSYALISISSSAQCCTVSHKHLDLEKMEWGIFTIYCALECWGVW